MKNTVLLALLLAITCCSIGQNDPHTTINKLGAHPLFIIDSVRISKEELAKYPPDSIASLVILYDTTAIKHFGDSAKDGAVVIETRTFARRNFISFFRQQSNLFDSVYRTLGNDNSFAYILNGKVQKGNYEGNLSAIHKGLLIGITIIPKEELESRYQVTDKEIGIAVSSRKPKNVYNADEKF